MLPRKGEGGRLHSSESRRPRPALACWSSELTCPLLPLQMWTGGRGHRNNTCKGAALHLLRRQFSSALKRYFGGGWVVRAAAGGGCKQRHSRLSRRTLQKVNSTFTEPSQGFCTRLHHNGRGQLAIFSPSLLSNSFLLTRKEVHKYESERVVWGIIE